MELAKNETGWLHSWCDGLKQNRARLAVNTTISRAAAFQTCYEPFSDLSANRRMLHRNPNF